MRSFARASMFGDPFGLVSLGLWAYGLVGLARSVQCFAPLINAERPVTLPVGI